MRVWSYTESKESQICMLLYCMGKGAKDIFTLIDVSEKKRKRYELVVANFDSFFEVRKMIFCAYLFNCQRQGENE